MNYGEINTMVSMFLGEQSTTFFTAADRLLAINQACKTIAGAADFLRHTVTFTTKDGVGSYLLPSSFRQMGDGIDILTGNDTSVGLEYKSIGELRRTNPNWEYQTGMPKYYTLENSNIYLNPAPDGEYTIRLNYQPSPNKLTKDTDLPFYGALRAEPYHDAIAYYATYLLAFKDKDYELANAMLNQYTTRLVDFKEELRNIGGPIYAFVDDLYRKENR